MEPTKATAVILLAVALPVLLTWKGLVESLWIGLTGRPWLTNTIAFGFAILFGGGTLFGVWVSLHPEWQPFLWSLVPWLARISHSAKKRTAFLGHKLLFNDNLWQTKRAVRWKHIVASNRLNSSPLGRGR
jgi:hypothetical protein